MPTLIDTTTALGITTILLAGAFLLLQPTGLVKWLQKKNYQYEVTFALYMLTPTEKFIFNSVLFLALAMVIIGCVLYLPDHIATMSRRAYYYCAGDTPLISSSRLYGTATRAGDAILDATAGWAATAYQAAMNKTAGATESLKGGAA